ncbi:MAG TPA: folylpolyglutamate synthase/dihydrofolate synthase family protein [Alphaproteobacteria bacterium]|nr:folylpolyglutamate synthase/dihydrofolate synthase family protein [Alphaproteobacteria bacterium]
MTEGRDPVEVALAHFGQLHSKTIDLTLGRLATRLGALGHPERRLPPVFHVAGTNGKGSTIALLRAFLEAAGHPCHVFTSPHLIRVNESIRVAGRLIADDELLAVLAEIEAAPGEPITSFEALTAAAFLAFTRTSADASLIEVGLGGRTDATNLIDRPLVTAVTRISYDHQRFLGDSLAAIAGEKAGIFKPGCPAVVAEQPEEAVSERLIAEADRVGAELFLHGRDWCVIATSAGFRYHGPVRTLELPMPALAGRHQLMNAGTALAMLDLSRRFQTDETAVRRGLASVVWPGRLERLTEGALVEVLPVGWELWLDGAHNDSGAAALADQLAVWGKTELALDLVFGVRADKRTADILTPLTPYVSKLRAVAIPRDSASATADAAAAAARSTGIADVQPAASILEAIQSLVATQSPVDSRAPRRILICGSLYLAGAALRENGSAIA